VTLGTVVVVDDVVSLVVVEPDVTLGGGAPVEKRQPAPGGLKAAMLTTGAGRFVSGFAGGRIGVVLAVEGGVLVVVGVAVVDGDRCTVVVGAALGERWLSFSWSPTMTSALTHSPSTTRKGQLGLAPPRVDSFGINFECNSGRRNYNNKRHYEL